MKRVQFEKTGSPDEVLELIDADIPEPGPGEVVVKVNACNINPSDIMYIKGLYGLTPRLPSGAGFEATGSIYASGEGVDFASGTRVVFTTIGAWQEYVCLPAKTLVPVPDQMDDQTACQAFINPFTAYGLLASVNLAAGDWLLLTAGASACAKFVIQMCRESKINTICTVRNDQQIDILKKTGANEVINTEASDLKSEVMRITQKQGVKSVFEAVGGPLANQALDCVAHHGTFIAYGMLSLKNMELNAGLLIFKNITIKGFWLTNWLAGLSKEEMATVSGKVLNALATQQVKADVEAAYPLNDVKKAVTHMESSGRNGKVILTLA